MNSANKHLFIRCSSVNLFYKQHRFKSNSWVTAVLYSCRHAHWRWHCLRTLVTYEFQNVTWVDKQFPYHSSKFLGYFLQYERRKSWSFIPIGRSPVNARTAFIGTSFILVSFRWMHQPIRKGLSSARALSWRRPKYAWALRMTVAKQTFVIRTLRMLVLWQGLFAHVCFATSSLCACLFCDN